MKDSVFQSQEAFRAPSSTLDSILDSYNAIETTAFPGAESEVLQKVLLVEAADPDDLPALKVALEATDNFSLVEMEYEQQTLSCPNPELYNDPGSLATDHIDNMELPCAWTITKGDPSVSVAILDNYFEEHSDLMNGYIDPDFDCNPAVWSNCSHGIAVAGGVSALHNNQCVAGAAPNTTIRGYCVGGSSPCNTVRPYLALWDAYIDGADVINVSAAGIGFGSTIVDMVGEITAGGTSIVVAAYESGHSAYANIPGVINVAQMDESGRNFVQYGSVQEKNVDIGVPILNLERLQVGNTCAFGTGNSSMAAPHVAGTVALMKAVNPCLTPAEIEIILENTSVPASNGNDPWDPWFGKTDGGRLDAYEAVLAAQAQSPGKTVFTNETWDVPETFSGDITVAAGATLTIEETTIRFANPLSRILVEQGGKLIVDGGTLTAGCNNDTWRGVEVLGTPNASQFDDTQHGVVELKNGATIEYAEVAVSLHRRNPAILGGGILQASNANFVNNARGVSFWDYGNFLPGFPDSEWRNLSNISGCTFTVDNDFPQEAFPGQVFSEHILLSQVRGIQIGGCTFDDERTGDITTPFGYPAGFGIRASGSGFSAQECTFTNLVYGINASNLSSLNNYSLRDCAFTGNFHAVHSRGVNNFTLKSNNFNVGGFTKQVSGIGNTANQVGVFIDHGTGFKVKENTFENSGGGQNIGVCAKNTNLNIVTDRVLGDDNTIFLNDFGGLDFGNLANGTNQAGLLGLAYICNTNGQSAANEHDFTVADGTVAVFQGDPLIGVAAGNTFTPDAACQVPLRHIDNTNDANFIVYTYSNGQNEEPICFDALRVSKVSGDKNDCTEGLGPISDGPIRGEVMNETLAKVEQFGMLLQQYESLLNGGDTGNPQQILDNLTVQNTAASLNQLQSYAPYLSGSVIRQVAEEPLFSNAQKLQLLALHPEVLRKAANWQFILQNGAFTSTEISTLSTARQQTTARDSLEQELASSRASMHRGADALIAYYMQDSTSSSLDSIRYWAGVKQSVSGEFLIVDTYLEENDTTAALQRLQQIEQDYGILPGFHLEYDQMKALKTLEAELVAQGSAWYELDSVQLASLESIAVHDQTAAGVEAQSVLNEFYDQGAYHEAVLPNGAQALIGLPQDEVETETSHVDYIRAFPNPTRDEVTFRYRLPKEVENAVLLVRNLNGQQVKRWPLQGASAAVNWSSHGLAPGVYTYTLILPNGQTESHKLVVLR